MDGSVIKYETKIVGDKGNEFYFTNIPAGKYKAIIENNTLGTIVVEENKVNNVKLIEK